MKTPKNPYMHFLRGLAIGYTANVFRPSLNGLKCKQYSNKQTNKSNYSKLVRTVSAGGTICPLNTVFCNDLALRHTLVCQRHVMAGHKISPREKEARNYTCPQCIYI